MRHKYGSKNSAVSYDVVSELYKYKRGIDIAIIVTECESITHPNMKEFNGQMYEFIYKGESAYITDANGHTVEVVR